MKIRLTRQDRVRLGHGRPVNPVAYDSFLKGTYAWHRFSPESFQTSIRFFKQAIEQEPEYALAHAWLANALNVMALHGFLNPFETLPVGEASARTALQLDGTLAEAHAVAAAYESSHWNWSAADREFRRALDLNPGWAHGHHMYAVLCLLVTRRLSESVFEMERAFELDPLSIANAIQFARILICRREYDRAVAVLKDFVVLDPNSAELYRWLGDAYFAKGLYAEAAEAYSRARAISPTVRDAWRLAQVHRARGSLVRARDSVQDIEQLCAGQYVLPSTATLISLAIGEDREALEWLARAVQMRDPALPFVVLLPICDAIRSDPRFTAVLRSMGVNDR
jgi:serine/threonine-protein kinase